MLGSSPTHAPAAARLLARTTAAALLLAIALLAGGCTKGPIVTRTDHGVVHINAKDFKSLGFGMGWSHAEDNYCATLDHLISLRGERRRYIGPGQSQFGLKPLQNNVIDRYVGFAMDDTRLQAMYQAMQVGARQLIDGYVLGYEKYAEKIAAEIPTRCGRLVRDWIAFLAADKHKMTSTDFLRWMEEFNTLLGAASLVRETLAARPPVTNASVCVPPAPPTSAAEQATIESDDGPDDDDAYEGAGSNGWAFGRDVLDPGAGLQGGVVVANPHFFWTGALRFWQVHLTIDGKLDVMGATMGMWPMVQIGFNRDMAWTHTVSTGARFVIHELDLDPNDPCKYVRADGTTGMLVAKPVPVYRNNQQVTWNVWHAPGYGPVIDVPDAGLSWDTRHVHVLRDANQGNDRALDDWLAIARARTVREVLLALEQPNKPPGIQWSNTLAADRHGDVLYADISVVPDIGPGCKLDLRTRKGQAWPHKRLPVVASGASAACGWVAGAPPALMRAAALPQLPRSDYVLNGNDSYWLANPHAPLPAHATLVGAVDYRQSLRTRAGLRAVEDHLGTGRKIDLVAARDLLLSNRNFAAELVLQDVLFACAQAVTPAQVDLAEACGVLARWDRTNNLDAPGAVLFREFWRRLTSLGVQWKVPYTKGKPPPQAIDYPQGLDISSTVGQQRTLGALQYAVDILRKATLADKTPLRLPLDATLRTVQTKQLVTQAGGRSVYRPLPVDGGEEDDGVLNKFKFTTTRDSLYEPVLGTSYVQVVGFDKDGPVADALLLYGQSADLPDDAQLRRFVKRDFLRLPFTGVEIKAHAVAPARKLPMP